MDLLMFFLFWWDLIYNTFYAWCFLQNHFNYSNIVNSLSFFFLEMPGLGFTLRSNINSKLSYGSIVRSAWKSFLTWTLGCFLTIYWNECPSFTKSHWVVYLKSHHHVHVIELINIQMLPTLLHLFLCRSSPAFLTNLNNNQGLCFWVIFCCCSLLKSIW